MSTCSEGGILDNEVLTVKEVATYLRVSRVTVWRWCQQGLIPASQVGRNWRIRRDDVLDLLEASQPSTSSDDGSTNLAPEAENNTGTLPVGISEQEEIADCRKDSSNNDTALDLEDNQA